MSLKYIITCFFTIWFLIIKAQEQPLHLIVSQNTYIARQDLWYGILFSNSTLKIIGKTPSYPTVHISLADRNNKIILRQLHASKAAAFTNKINIPSTVEGGTYVLTASIYDLNMINIVEEISIPIFILGAESNSFITFSESSGVHSNIDAEKITASKFTKKLRSPICLNDFVDKDQNILSISKSDFLLSPNTFTYHSGSKDLQYGYVKRVRIESKHQLPGFHDQQTNQVYQFKRLAAANEYYLELPNFGPSKPGQYLDLITKEIIPTVTEIFPVPKWLNVPTTSLDVTFEKLDSLKLDLEKTELISKIFNTSSPEMPKAMTIKRAIEPDNFIQLDQYQLFENIELFITEVIEILRVVRHKNKPTDLRLLREDIKSYYAGSPMLILNGNIHQDLSALFDIPYRDIATIGLYRKISTTRKVFGPMGIFGVVEVTTKPSYITPSNAVIIRGFQAEQKYVLNNNKEFSPDDPSPSLSPVLYFGSGSANGPFCYTHNDQLGTFIVQYITSDAKKTLGFTIE